MLEDATMSTTSLLYPSYLYSKYQSNPVYQSSAAILEGKKSCYKIQDDDENDTENSPNLQSRRSTMPQLNNQKCIVVKLDPTLFASSSSSPVARADLDDISQPDNGMNADAECSATETESEEENKEEEVISETPYVVNENEVFGMVSCL